MSNKSENYSNELLGRPRRRAKHSFIGVLFVIVLLAVTISFSVALMIAYLTPYVAPSTFGSLTIVGIFAPILYMGVAICMLLWLVVRRWRIAGVVALLLIPGLFRVSDFYNIDFMRKVETPISSRALTVLSYNIRGFYDDNQHNAVAGYVDYFSQIEDLDVVCLQEYACEMRGTERIDSLFAARFDDKCYVNDVTEAGDVVLRTYSRYPIIASGELSGEGRGTSQWVDVVVGKSDTIRVFNNHLHSMDISSADSSDIANGTILNDGDRMQSIVDRIATHSSIRAEYVDTLRTVIDNSPYRNVICGDFNDTPMSYVYRELKRGHIDAFEQSGSGYGYTFRPMHGTLRIDYILHSKELETEDYFVDEENELSDHLPITARIKILPKEGK